MLGSRRVILILAFMFCSYLSYGQKTKEIVAKSHSDISFSVGPYMNTKSEPLQYGTVYSLDYARFEYNNIGFRGGVNFIDNLGDGVSMMGVPLHFAWRTAIDKRTLQERYTSSAYSFVATDGNIPSALISLAPIRLELIGGLTPMFATSAGDVTWGLSPSIGKYTEELSVKNTFALSADIGARLNIRIWRINLFFAPQYHYWLTDNFTHSIKYNSSVEYTKINRSYLSLSFGVNFILK